MNIPQDDHLESQIGGQLNQFIPTTHSVVRIDSPERIAACYQVRSLQYSRYYRNIPIENFSDRFDRSVDSHGNPVSKLFGVSRDDSIVGTCRLLCSRDPQQPSLESEVCELFDLNWRQVSETVGVLLEKLCVGELGKFSVIEGEESRATKWQLLTSAGEQAVRYGMHVVIAIMPPVVERSARQAGVRFNRFQNVSLRRETMDLKKYLLRYHDYFLPAFRKSGLDIDIEHLERVPPVVLDMLLSGMPDGPSLWWIKSHDLAEAKIPNNQVTEVI